jgi:hypothetical protein
MPSSIISLSTAVRLIALFIDNEQELFSIDSILMDNIHRQMQMKQHDRVRVDVYCVFNDCFTDDCYHANK